jgi:hypothetical protein
MPEKASFTEIETGVELERIDKMIQLLDKHIVELEIKVTKILCALENQKRVGAIHANDDRASWSDCKRLWGK